MDARSLTRVATGRKQGSVRDQTVFANPVLLTNYDYDADSC